jgi:multimeric flavodoxin WrbA
VKILAIIGSPRKGNSYRIARRVEEKMKTLGAVEFDYVFLKDANLQPCRGCFLCTAKGEEYCPIDDDVPQILDAMLQADGVVFVSPVYALSVTALMKNFKDRLAYNAHRPRFFGKYALVITTSAGTGLAETEKYLSNFSMWGFEVASKLRVITYPFLAPAPRLERKIAADIEVAATRFFRAIEMKKLRPPGVLQVMQFRVLKCNTAVARNFWRADYEFYKDREEYYYDARIAPHKKLAAWLFEKLYMHYMNANYVLDRDG